MKETYSNIYIQNLPFLLAVDVIVVVVAIKLSDDDIDVDDDGTDGEDDNVGAGDDDNDFKCPVDSDDLSLAFIYAWIKFLVVLDVMKSLDPSTIELCIFNVLLVSMWLFVGSLCWINEDVVVID